MLLDVKCYDSTANFWKKTVEEKNPERFSSLDGGCGPRVQGQNMCEAGAKSSSSLPGVGGITTFHSHSLPSGGNGLSFFLCPACECAMVAPTDEGLSTAADGSQSSLYV